MEMENRKKNNKGFSLVELIVVIAIMAVLIAVLSPQLIRYVERTRLQRDNSAIAEIANAAKIAGAEEAVNTQLAAAGDTGVTINPGTGNAPANVTYTLSGSTNNALLEQLNASLGGTIVLSSNTYTTNDAPSLTVRSDDNGNVTVTASGYFSDPNADEDDSFTF